MYKVISENEGIIAVFDTVLEALAYCQTFDWVRMNPNGTFSPMRIDN